MLVCAVIVGVPIFFARTSYLQINAILVSGNSVVATSRVEDVVRSVLSGNYWYVFPKSNIFLYPKNALQKALYEASSRIEIVEISTTPPHTIAVSLREREVRALWCPGEVLSDCFFLDSRGFVFDRAPSFTKNVYFVYRGNIEGDPIGKQYISKDLFRKAELFTEHIRSLGLDPVSLVYTDDDEATISLAQGGSILFSLRDDITKNTSNLESVLLDSSLGLVKNGALTVLSIDLRYGNKVILKKKGE